MERTGRESSARSRALLVFAIVVVGLALRAIPILWGTTFVDRSQVGFHPDETKLIRIADRFPESVVRTEDYRYPLLAHDVLGLLWRGALLVHPIEPDPLPRSGEPRFEVATVFMRSIFVLILGGCGMVMLAYFTRRLGEGAAIPWVLAAYSMQSFTVANTALVQPDLPMAFALFAIVTSALSIERRGSWRWVRDPLVLGGLLGLAVATKYTALVGLLPCLAIASLAGVRQWVGARELFLGALLFFGTAALVFVAVMPGIFAHFDDFRASLAYELYDKTRVAEFDLAKAFERFRLALPLWLLGLSAVGLVASRAARQSVVIAATIAMLGCYVFLVRQALSSDWILPLMPLVAVLSGLALHGLSSRLGSRGTVAAVALVLVGWTHAALTVHARYAGDTRYRFRDWVVANLEAPGPIGEAPAPTRRSWASARAPEGYTFTGVDGQPEWIVASEREYWPVQVVHENPRHFENAGVVFDPEKGGLAQLDEAEIGFFRDLLVPTGEIQWTPPEGYTPRFDYELVETFEPAGWPLDMEGLEIRLYRRRGAGSTGEVD